MSDNIRTALYDAEYDVRLVSRGSQVDGTGESSAVARGRQALRVAVTSWCATAGCLRTSLRATCSRWPPPGAYCYSMASSYNRLPRPAVVAVRDGAARAILRRETVADQFRLEVTP